jgi:ribulose-bisphosphate carboxylase small chain
MFDLKDPAGALMEVNNCRKAFPSHYIRVSAFDDTHGVESLRLSFIVNRPAEEPGFRLEREETNGRSMRYKLHAYAADKPEGQRY